MTNAITHPPRHTKNWHFKWARSTRIRDWAIRRAGELLKQIEPAKGGDRKSEEYQRVAAVPLIGNETETASSRKEAGEAAGMSERQIKTAIRVADIPEENFNRQVERWCYCKTCVARNAAKTNSSTDAIPEIKDSHIVTEAILCIRLGMIGGRPLSISPRT